MSSFHGNSHYWDSKANQRHHAPYQPQEPPNNPVFFRSMSMDLNRNENTSSINFHLDRTRQADPKAHQTSRRSSWATDKLRRIGYYHPVDPSHACFPKTQLDGILTRLTDCLRALSCRVSYAEQELGAACETMDQVQFQVNFFQKDSHTVLVEVQRRSGDSYIFHHDYAQPILAVVRGLGVSNRHQPMNYRTALLMDHLAMVVSDEDITEALELAANLVMADRHDACRLGMESLVMLTDPTSTGLSTARRVARALIMPANETYNKLVQTMLHCLLDCGERDLTFYALNVWTNAWQVAANDSEVHLDDFCGSVCPTDTLIHSLMSRVENVNQQPHEATLALRGLTALCREMPRFRPCVSWHSVERAREVGSLEHAALEQASRKFLEGH